MDTICEMRRDAGCVHRHDQQSPRSQSGTQASRQKFTSMRIETGPMSRADADAWERASLKDYRSVVGKNPRYNKTLDGQWEPRPRKNSTRRNSADPKIRNSRSLQPLNIGRRRNRPF